MTCIDFVKFIEFFFFQKVVEKRMKNDIENDLLNRNFFLRFQDLIKNINFYIQIFKNCDERVKKNSIYAIKFT